MFKNSFNSSVNLRKAWKRTNHFETCLVQQNCVLSNGRLWPPVEYIFNFVANFVLSRNKVRHGTGQVRLISAVMFYSVPWERAVLINNCVLLFQVTGGINITNGVSEEN